MIRLAKQIKDRNQSAAEENNNQRPAPTQPSQQRPQIRDKLLLKEVQEMHNQMPKTCKTVFADPNKLYRFDLCITPSAGGDSGECFWSGGNFWFAIDVPKEYNILPPHVKCLTRIWHPNISEDGDICLSLLRESSIDALGWAPTRTLKDVVWGLNSLFTDLLNFDDPLNDEAAEHYLRDRDSFQLKVRDYVHKYAKS